MSILMHREKLVKSHFRIALLLTSLLLPGYAAPAQDRLPAVQPYRTDTPPLIDGVLDDLVWKKAPKETGFKTWRPDFGRPMADETVVYYAYDKENLYFACQCYDSEPEKIKASVTSRDNINNDDWICINLDSFDDQQSLYALYVNPLGIQGDSRFAAGREDFGLDLVWYSAGKIHPRGYTIEMKIPFKSIRFSHREPVRMGVVFERNISRRSEGGTYPPLDPKKGPNFLIQTRPLQLEDIQHYALMELLPGFTFSRRSAAENGRLSLKEQDADFSFNIKYGVTSHLILDGTVNPDFSQVESDAGQVDFNQRFALFYPEKRPFFLEGLENFNFGGAQSSDPLSAIVHTRQIVNPLAGAKLSGRVGERNTISTIYALNELPQSENGRDYAQFAIIRYKRSLNQDSYLGGIYTGREDGERYNRVAGMDGQLRLSDSTLFGFHALGSQANGQLGNPGNRSGHALGVDYDRSDRNLLLNVGMQEIGRDFTTDSGYITRAGITRLRFGIAPLIYPKSGPVRRIDPLFHSFHIHDKESGLWETYDSADLRLTMRKNTALVAGYSYATEVYQGRKFKTGGLRLSGQSQLWKEFSLRISYARKQKIRYIDAPFQGRGSDATVSATYQPSTKLNFSLSYTYSDLADQAEGAKIFDYTILRSRNTYQVNKYLFLRGIVEYNSFRRRIMTDFLASFTYIPGTVIYCGYGSLYEKIAWTGDHYAAAQDFGETARGLFFKASYLLRR